MTPQIVEKLKNELRIGLRRESQVVYFLAGVRKIIEQDGLSDQFEYLEFHCNWALHARLKGPFAQKVLAHFDSAHSKIINGERLVENDEANKISKMNRFQEDMSAFLGRNSIPDFSQNADAWANFIFLYARVIEDCPLVIWANSTAHISNVIVSVEMGKKSVADHNVFKVSWHVTERGGRSGTMFVLNSFEKGDEGAQSS